MTHPTNDPMNEIRTPGADEARRRLAEAEGRTAVSTRDIRVLQRLLIGVGLAMGAVLLLIRASAGNALGLILGMLVYGVVIAALVFYGQTAQSAPRGFGKRYVLGIVLTSALYGLGVALTTGGAPWTLVIVLAIATATPAILVARSFSRLGAS